MPHQLSFYMTAKFPFPVNTTGSGTALTVGLFGNDPCLIFLTQTSYADEIVYLKPCDGSEIFRHSSPPGRDVIVSMHWDPVLHEVWCASGTNNFNDIFAFEVRSGVETRAFSVAGVSALTQFTFFGPGIATDGLNLFRCGRSQASPSLVEGFHKNGTLFTSYAPPTIGATDMCIAPQGWAYYLKGSDEVLITDKFGQELAVATLPNSGSGSSGTQTNAAIAFDMVSPMRQEPQVWNGCAPGAAGTIHHPATPWNPSPFTRRHKLYFANEQDQTIYGGYLY